ncbi:MAG: peptidoglycan DD-metalloendopeptidase family protein [Gemmatimonadales bacterium]|nr:peptidoglycan DD-metalloendopeptidase family protein [Gemmatimonadales bacterium]
MSAQPSRRARVTPSRVLCAVSMAVASPILGGCGSGVEPEQLSATCLARADFGDPAQSHYVLPYPAGAAYEVAQGYCGSGPWSSHNERFAIDFHMPIGAPLVASRGGVVVYLIDEFDDSGMNDDSQLNYIIIQHEDGTAAAYVHIEQRSTVVQVGETVTLGQRIANSGNSGFTDNNPHLHFELFSRFPYDFPGDNIPVTFRNAGGLLDERGGLQYGVTYTALPW